ncbi:MAG: hypothetical protein ABJK37_01695 [Paraglaciecola sp.]|uniref:hypothetical protein n=1 Tax=Paraglaciecola sp. TaxID=1920173 RepID=UPI003298435C
MKNVILNSKVLKALALASGLLMSTFSAQADLVLSFSESDVEVGLNDTFTLDLYVTQGAPVDALLAWGLDVNFDNGILALNSFTLGSDFSSVLNPLVDGDGIGGASTSFGLFSLSPILLGSFEFTAVGYGATSLFTSNTIGDLFEGFTTLNQAGSTFNSAASNISVVSAPATLGLFTIALAGLVSLRRKA